MNISDMHIYFRQFAQQMGMQNVRAILPEQIDILINTSIQDTFNEVINENLIITNDKVVADNSKIGQINGLKTLYKTKYIDMNPDNPWDDNVAEETRKFWFKDKSDTSLGKLNNNFDSYDDVSVQSIDEFLIVDCSISYRKVVNKLGYGFLENSAYVKKPTRNPSSSKEYLPRVFNIYGYYKFEAYNAENGEYEEFRCHLHIDFLSYSSFQTNGLGVIKDGHFNLYLESFQSMVDYGTPHYTMAINKEDIATSGEYDYVINPVDFNFSLHHGNEERSYTKALFDYSTPETKFYPIRIIEESVAANTLSDPILKNKLTSPIMVIHGNREGTIYDLYIDKFHENEIHCPDDEGNDFIVTRYVLKGDLIPCRLKMSYIAKPAIVNYKSKVNCDLPEYMHTDIVKRAVDLYRISVSGTLHSSQGVTKTNNTQNN